jgi:transposase
MLWSATMAKKTAGSDGKVSALRASGAFNSNADEVVYELFSGNPFFDARDLVQVKYEMLRSVHKDGWSVSRAADAFGFSRPSFYEAQAGLQETGLAGLVPRRRGPKGAHKLSDEVIAFIREEIGKEEKLSPTDLAKRVSERFGVTVHPRSIGRALKAQAKKKSRGAI